MKMSDFELKAIMELSPGAIFRIPLCESIFDNISENLIWHDGERPNDNDIKTKSLELYTTWKNQQYFRDRVEEYPSIGDQLDALFKAGVFPEEMAAQIQAVKNKYPKPE